MEFTVKRSPGKVCWWVCCNGSMITTADTRQEADSIAKQFAAKYA